MTMLRSGVVKNALFVVMVISCYMTIRIMMLSNSMETWSTAGNEYGIHLPAAGAPGRAVASLGLAGAVDGQLAPLWLHEPPLLPDDPLDIKGRAAIRHNTSQGRQLVQESVCHSGYLGTPDSVLTQAPEFTDVTCHKLLTGGNGSEGVYKRAKEFMKSHELKKVSDEEYVKLTQDCQKFKLSHSYHITPGSEEERDFPIAYNILMHKDLHQVEMLLRAIYRPQHVICIHVDAKQDDKLHLAVKKLVRCFDNVFIASKLERIVYAGFTRLKADVNCMEDHLQNAIRWKYLINLAGQSFPLRSNLEMVRVLKAYNGANDVEGIYGHRVHRSRFELEWKEVDVETNHPKLQKTGKKNPPVPHDIDIVRGSAYGVFSRDFVKFIIEDERSQALLNWSRNTWSPDEHFWATLHHTYSNPHLKTPGGYNGKPDEKPWLAVWVAWGGMDKCHGMWKRGTCVFGVEDLPSLVSHRELFANKFYYDYQPLVMECLNNWMEHKARCPGEGGFNISYYEKLPYVKPQRGQIT